MANKHTNKYTCLVIRKMQVRTTRRYYLTPTRRAGIKQNKNGKEQVLVKKWGKLETSVCVAGAGDVVEKSLAVSQKPQLYSSWREWRIHVHTDSRTQMFTGPRTPMPGGGDGPISRQTTVADLHVHQVPTQERSSDTCYGLCEP